MDKRIPKKNNRLFLRSLFNKNIQEAADHSIIYLEENKIVK